MSYRPCSSVIVTILAAALLLASAAAPAQTAFPVKPVRMIVPYPPGGGLTPTARLLGQKLTELWGQQVIIDNRGGGNTIIGSEAVARAAPDGYTLLFQANSHMLTPMLMSVPYDPIRDFTAVATTSVSEMVLVTHPSVKAANLQELIALAKARPGQLDFGTSGSGNVTHMAIELVNLMAGVKMQQVPYKGSGPAMADLLGGQFQVYMGVTANVIPHIRTGKLTGIAVTGDRRIAAIPQVPTLAEAGLPGFPLKVWTGVFGPSGLPRPLLERLSGDFTRVQQTGDFRDKLGDLALEPFISTPEQFLALLKTEQANFQKVIAVSSIKLD